MSRTYTQDFQKDALSYVRSHRELTLTEAAANLGIPKGTLYGWVKAERRREAFGEGSPEGRKRSRLRSWAFTMTVTASMERQR